MRSNSRTSSSHHRGSNPKVLDSLRDKTLAAKKQLDETSINVTAIRYYKQMSPFIWLWVCRASGFIWCYMYHSYQSLFILLWVLHSTLFQDNNLFFRVTSYFYLPIFCLIFLFYYIINIPTVVDFGLI